MLVITNKRSIIGVCILEYIGVYLYLLVIRCHTLPIVTVIIVQQYENLNDNFKYLPVPQSCIYLNLQFILCIVSDL